MKKLFTILFILSLVACTKDKYLKEEVDNSCYPPEISKILVQKCATSGCHNTQSAGLANGLDYSTWENMFKGGKNGSSVIPYSTEYSYVLYFCNPDSNLGPMLPPQMPYNREPLSTEEYLTLRDWIAGGAPDCNGVIRFSDNPDRKKFYVCMQSCDQVAVYDSETRVIMRYIEVGVNPNLAEGPHQVRITPDGKYWCVVFIANTNIFQVFNTSDDQLVSTIQLMNAGTWNTMAFSPDSKKAYLCNTGSTSSEIAFVDLENMAYVNGVTSIASPHGIYVTQDGNFLYVTSQNGNQISTLDLTTFDQTNITISSGAPNADPHEIIFLPGESKFYVSCQARSEVRVFEASPDHNTNTIIDTIQVGEKPQEFAISEEHNLLFVTCTEDPFAPGQVGSLYIIDYTTDQVIKQMYVGYQPHGIAVDEDHDVVYISNLNYSLSGPAPHHSIDGCGNRNGYISILDLNTLELLRVTLPDGSNYIYKNEVLSFPYFISYRK